MKYKIDKISNKYKVVQMTEDKLQDLYEFCLENTTYYGYLHMQPTIENLRETLTDIPPNVGLDEKVFIGFYDEDKLIAISDIIMNYPKEHTAYLGWFMIRKDQQGKSVGNQLFQEIIEYLREQEMQQLYLAYIKDNVEAKGFWEKNLFQQVGNEIDKGEYDLLQMVRNLENY